jgi:O-antigen ligase
MTFIATCIFTLLYFIRPFEIIASLKDIPILFVVGIIASMLLLADVISGKVKFFRNGTDQMMLGFYIAIGLSHISHLYFGGAQQSLKDFFPVIVGYFLIAHSIDSEKKMKMFIAVLIFCAAFLACEGILQARNGVSFFGVKPLEYAVEMSGDGSYTIESRIKWVGPFSDPNDLAMVFVVVVPFLLEYLRKRVIIVPFFLLALIIYGLYLTNSRGGMLALVVAISSYFILRYKTVKGLWIGLFLALLLVALGPSRMGNMSASEESAYGRLESWYSGFQMFKKAPIMGVGQGMYTDYNDLTAHNSLVLVFSELGFLGAFFFVGVFYFPIMYTYKAKFDKSWQNLDLNIPESYDAIAGGLIGTMASMLFLSRSYVLLPYILVALPMSILSRTSSMGSSIYMSNYSNYKKIFFITAFEMMTINIVIKVLL